MLQRPLYRNNTSWDSLPSHLWKEAVSQAWSSLLPIRQMEGCHGKYRLHCEIKETDASSSKKPPLISPPPGSHSFTSVFTGLPLPPALELLKGRNCILFAIVSSGPHPLTHDAWDMVGDQ